MRNEARFIHPTVIILGEKIDIGRGTWIGPNVLLDAQLEKITIGEWCDISAGAQIYTHSTDERCVTGDLAKKVVGPVSIGDRCYLGPNSIVTCNTVIGPHSKVGALSMVKGRFGENSRIYGIPGRSRA